MKMWAILGLTGSNNERKKKELDKAKVFVCAWVIKNYGSFHLFYSRPYDYSIGSFIYDRNICLSKPKCKLLMVFQLDYNHKIVFFNIRPTLRLDLFVVLCICAVALRHTPRRLLIHLHLESHSVKSRSTLSHTTPLCHTLHHNNHTSRHILHITSHLDTSLHLERW